MSTCDIVVEGVWNMDCGEIVCARTQTLVGADARRLSVFRLISSLRMGYDGTPSNELYDGVAPTPKTAGRLARSTTVDENKGRNGQDGLAGFGRGRFWDSLWLHHGCSLDILLALRCSASSFRGCFELTMSLCFFLTSLSFSCFTLAACERSSIGGVFLFLFL